jgi:hypothetical protein
MTEIKNTKYLLLYTQLQQFTKNSKLPTLKQTAQFFQQLLNHLPFLWQTSVFLKDYTM